MPDYTELKETLLIPGKSFHIFYNEGNPNNCLAHIRAIVDGEWVVWREWVGPNLRWIYKVNYIHMFWLLNHMNYIERNME